uniref:Uncharacterized protein n=1 Tax=Monopterus albus TaxID=43700 RepID=A0A3Q3IWD8_MONAL
HHFVHHWVNIHLNQDCLYSGELNYPRSPKDYCLHTYGGLDLQYIKGTNVTFQFDLCDVIDCGTDHCSWRRYDVYLCPESGVNERCVGQLVRTRNDRQCNPLLLSIVHLTTTGYTGPVPSSFNGEDVTWAAHSPKMLYFILGVDHSGTDTKALIKLIVNTGTAEGENSSDQKEIIAIDYNKLTYRDIVKLATGYDEKNVWLNWLTKTAKEQGMEDCIACASARPYLFTTPAPLYPNNDTWGYGCMLKLTKEPSPFNCTTLASIYPPISNKTLVGAFNPSAGYRNYTCFNFTTRDTPVAQLGAINRTWCSAIVPDGHTHIGPWARGGLYWYCGAHRLFVQIPQKGVGICAMVRLCAPLALIGTRGMVHRRRHVITRRVISSFDLSLNSPTYIDAIGVPRGVPDECKLADQIAAGFESLPIVSALFPVTPNKNVDCINYVHYNVLRLANLTRDAVEGLSEQLAPTSLMAVQNRMALDMLLAFLTTQLLMDHDGSVTRALEGLRTLSKTMHEHSGIDNPIDAWFNRMFGKWKGVIVSVLITVAIMITVLITCGCCCVPCIRSLCNRLITTAIEGRDRDMNPKQMIPLLEQEEGIDECEKVSCPNEQ